MKKTYPTTDKAKGHRGPHLTKETKRRANKSTRRLLKPTGVVGSFFPDDGCAY